MNKKGFTLVELLAVIAILAILMLLIMPNVLNMFNTGRKDAFKVQVNSIVKAAEEQRQSDVFNSSVTYMYCYGTGTDCTPNMSLNTSEGDVKYMVVFDSYNKVTGVALSNSNYCYIKSGNVSDINTNDFIENSALSCTGTTCTCSGSQSVSLPSGVKYAYWTMAEGGNGTNYSKTQMPSTAKTSLAALGFTDSSTYIRTSLDNNGNPFAHELCIYYSEKSFCTDNEIISDDVSVVGATMKSRMEEAFGEPAGSYSVNTSSNGVSIRFGTANIYKNVSGYTDSHVNSNTLNCRVATNGGAGCWQ